MKKNFSTLILCGGKGSRLNKLGKKIPKTLVKVNNKHFIEHIIKGLDKNYINNKIEFEERSLLLLDKAIPKIEVMLRNYNLRYKKASSILNISLVSMIKHYQDIFLRKTVSFKANMLTKNFNFTKDDFLEVSKSLINSTVNIFDKKTNSLQLQSGLLDVLSHNSVLKRGFAIVKDKKSKIITSSKKIKEDEELMINFYKNDKIKVSLKRDK